MSEFKSLQIKISDAKEIALKKYNINGRTTTLPGELDFNFKIDNEQGSYILKISRPDVDLKFIDFQSDILQYVSKSDGPEFSPKLFRDINGQYISTFIDKVGNQRIVRLLSWIDGRLWSSVNPINNELLFSIGEQAAIITTSLQDFDHSMAHRSFQWDINQSLWTEEFLYLLNDEQKKIVTFFLEKFKSSQNLYQNCRKSVIHNDVNDNNIVVTETLINPEVKAIIDYGDAIFTQTINDLAVVIAYAVMGKPDLLDAAIPIVKGYHSRFNLLEEELELLYTLVAMRLVISVTKSAINRLNEPNNKYLLISEKPAWEVLKQWILIDENLATYSFRKGCGFSAHPKTEKFKTWADKHTFKIHDLFPTVNKTKCIRLDMGMQSSFLGHTSIFNDLDQFEFKLSQLSKQHSDKIPAGGYLETRPIYTTDEYKKEGNNGPEYRAIHLGIDFWLPSATPVHAIIDGTVFLATNDAGYKEYGGLVILKHKLEDFTFYTLYGHQSIKSIERLKKGDKISKGDFISELGTHNENGNWGTHLHFQIILDMLGNENEFPGVCYPAQKPLWADLCPNPNILFNDENLTADPLPPRENIIQFRKRHLGKSLSLSYVEPLNIVRGEGAFLIDETGRRYLDTVNNVAHVGHEHLRIVKAAQHQISLLNTNTRYLHQNINDFAAELLKTFPKELCVVHFVNSGSEANELALRMAKTSTSQKDMIALEVGYHGNANACVDVSSYKFDGKGGEGSPEYTHIVPLPDSFRGIYKGIDTGKKYANHIQKEIKTIQSKGRNVAAFIFESIVSCGGQIELPDGFLKNAVEMVKKAGGLSIADEVQVGCGRVGTHFWGFQQHDVIPDIVTIGKPIGNGHPLAAVICTRKVADAFANGMEYFNTFGGNPVSCTIGLEVLNVIKNEKLQENALTIGNYLKGNLFELKKEFPIIGDIRGQGLFLGIELTDKNLNPLTETATYLANRMKELGILMSTDGKDLNVLKIKPPMVFSKENADELIFRLKQVLSEDFTSNH